MAFCRFSDDDYRCEVYIYESDEGDYVVHVAGQRVQWDPPKPNPYDPEQIRKLSDKKVLEAEKRYQHLLRSAPKEKIELPFAGRSFREEEIEAVIVRVQLLKELGYRIPDWVLEALDEEYLGSWEEDPEKQKLSPIWEL